MARREKAPAYQAYAADDLADAATMTREQFGIWNVLRAVAWRDVGLPTDPDELAVIMGVRRKDFARTWAIIGRPFEEVGGRYVLPWQEQQRAKHAALRERNAENGAHGGRPRQNPEETQTEPTGFPEVNPDESTSNCKLLGSTTLASSSLGDAADPAVRPTRREVAVALVRAANQAVTEVWGESPSPYLPGAGAADDLAALVLEEQIAIDTAVRAVFTACRAFCRKAKARAGEPFSRPGAMVYFRKPIQDAWARRQASEDAGDTPAPAPLEDAPAGPAGRTLAFPDRTRPPAPRTYAYGPATAREEDVKWQD